MNLKDLIAQLKDPEDDLRRAAIQKRLDELRTRVTADPRSVSDTDLATGIRDQFDLDPSSDFLDRSDWLMNALSFTHKPISSKQVSTAWDAFQRDGDFAFDYEDYPILEAISSWYFEHKDEPERDQLAMVARSVAVLEYLFAQIRGREASDDYKDILAGNGVTILSLYWVLKDYERVKFYANLLDLEYRAGRLGEDEYLASLQFYEECLVREKDPSVSTIDTDLHKINQSLIKLLWDTWSDRESKIDQLAKANAELYEELARRDDSTYPEPARRELSKLFGKDWNRLEPETKSHLERAYTFLQEPYCTHSPAAAPDALFMAVKAELLARLFKPTGLLDEEILQRTNTTNPVKLLIAYGKGKRLSKQEREFIRTALQKAGSKANLLTQPVLVGLLRLVEDRDRIHHQESGENAPYTFMDLERCATEVWKKGWLVPFLQGIHTPAQVGGDQR